MWVISWPAERLSSSPEELCFREWIICLLYLSKISF